jgi:uncharacterized membrane protein YhaH (DUF805 family)
MYWYFKVLRNYAGFSGRARRKEYWMFALMHIIVSMCLGVLLGIAQVNDIDAISNLWTLAFLLPSVAVGVRRMHDIDHSGWWILVPFVNLFLLCSEGTRGPNRFGPDPKADEAAMHAIA